MAFSCSSSSLFKSDLTCSVCLDYFEDPVLTRCEHTFCRRCLLEFWSQQQRNICPICRKICPSDHLPRNRALAGVIESLRRQEGAQVCSPHQQKVAFFCKDDQELICCQCRDAQPHRSHTTISMEEALAEYKEEIESTLKSLQDRTTKCDALKMKSEKYLTRLQDWARQTECQIKNSFRKLHVYLNDEESCLIQQVRQEERDSSRKLQNMTEQLFQELEALRHNIQEIERQMKDSVLNMKGLKDIQVRLARTLPTPVLIMHKVPFGKFSGPMEYRVWKKLRRLLDTVPATVTLDPQSAHPSLVISADGSSVRLVDARLARDVCSKVSLEPCVLATQGYSSGCHYWEVQVTGERWALGVSGRSAAHGGRVALTPQHGNWPLTFRNGTYECFHPLHTLPAPGKPCRIGLFLNLERGYLSYYDAEDMSHIFTVPSKCSEQLYPCFVPPASGKALSLPRSMTQ
uniref:E3 ubiquitin-protein ligase TRIM39-like n=1 Tax=Pristiophorus japonicus TaxID=55135 RepID=UPI00398EA0BD